MDDVPEMVMKVARAIDDQLHADPHLPTVARAAIEAMRLKHQRGDAPDIIQAKRAWNTGIDAALASPTKE